jgi:hypothetical protein
LSVTPSKGVDAVAGAKSRNVGHVVRILALLVVAGAVLFLVVMYVLIPGFIAIASVLGA